METSWPRFKRYPLGHSALGIWANVDVAVFLPVECLFRSRVNIGENTTSLSDVYERGENIYTTAGEQWAIRGSRNFS